MTTAGDWLVAVASDGAGSASHGDIGAKVASRAFHSRIEKHLQAGQLIADLTPLILENWLQTFRAEIETQAEALEAPIRDFASTLLAFIVGPDRFAFIQLGDGAIIYRLADTDSPYLLAEWPDNGEYENQTYFLTDREDIQRFRYGVVEGNVSEVAIITDGLQRIALDYAERVPFAPFFRPILAALKPEMDGEQPELSDALESFLSSSQVNNRTNDDKTLIIASRSSGYLSVQEINDDDDFDEASLQ